MSGLFEALASADTWLFLKLNRDWTHASLDALMPVLTDLHKAPWFIWGVAPASAALWLWREGKRALQIAVLAAIACGVVDLVAYRVLKPNIGRARPVRALNEAVARAPISGWNGMPSNHAAGVSSVASVLSVAYPGARAAWIASAAAIAYSRVYVGAHYPGDVLVGLLLGFSVGWPWARLMLGGRSGGKPKMFRKRR